MGGFFSAPFSENVDFTYSTADLLKNQRIISDIRGERIKEEMKKVKILKDTIEVLQKDSTPLQTSFPKSVKLRT